MDIRLHCDVSIRSRNVLERLEREKGINSRSLAGDAGGSSRKIRRGWRENVNSEGVPLVSFVYSTKTCPAPGTVIPPTLLT